MLRACGVATACVPSSEKILTSLLHIYRELHAHVQAVLILQAVLIPCPVPSLVSPDPSDRPDYSWNAPGRP